MQKQISGKGLADHLAATGVFRLIVISADAGDRVVGTYGSVWEAVNATQALDPAVERHVYDAALATVVSCPET